jgi:hypothetical protein
LWARYVATFGRTPEEMQLTSNAVQGSDFNRMFEYIDPETHAKTQIPIAQIAEAIAVYEAGLAVEKALSGGAGTTTLTDIFSGIQTNSSTVSKKSILDYFANDYNFDSITQAEQDHFRGRFE